MKVYVAVNVYTSNERGAIGSANEIELFKSKEEALKFADEDFHSFSNDEKPSYNEREIMGCDGKKWLEISFRYTNYCGDENIWVIKEFEI